MWEELPLSMILQDCSRHFTNEQFEANRADGKRKLKPNAIPTLFSHRPEKSTRKPPTNREISSSLIEEDNGMNLGMCVGIDTQQHLYMQQKAQQLSSNDPAEIQINPLTITTSNINDNGREFCNIQDHVYLQQKISELDRIIDIQRKKIGNLESLIENMEDKVKVFMNEDQIKFMQKSTVKGLFKWSDATIQKAIKIHLSCGTAGYNVMRELGQPLPSERTLRRKLEGLKFEPGILKELFPSLEHKIASMNPHEKDAILMIDEMAITPGLDFDRK